jgi:hypothetical protein
LNCLGGSLLACFILSQITQRSSGIDFDLKTPDFGAETRCFAHFSARFGTNYALFFEVSSGTSPLKSEILRAI